MSTQLNSTQLLCLHQRISNFFLEYHWISGFWLPITQNRPVITRIRNRISFSFFCSFSQPDQPSLLTYCTSNPTYPVPVYQSKTEKSLAWQKPSTFHLKPMHGTKFSVDFSRYHTNLHVTVAALRSLTYQSDDSFLKEIKQIISKLIVYEMMLLFKKE